MTAPQYIRAETAHLQEERRRRLEEQRQERERRQYEANIKALLERQEALIKPAVAFIRQDAGTDASPWTGDPEPDFAMGVPVHLAGKPYAVICPVAARIPALRRRLAKLVLIVASERERQRVAAQAGPGQRIVVLEPEPAAPAVPQQTRQNTVTVHQAVTRMLGRAL